MTRLVLDGSLAPAQVRKLADALTADKLVLVPTETGYLIVCRQEAKLGQFGYDLRGRLVRDPHELRELSSRYSPDAAKLVSAFLPGPLTLIVATLSGDTAVQMPYGGPGSQLLSQVSGPVFFREVLDCVSARDVEARYAGRVDIWLDAGAMLLRPTTLVDMAGPKPAVRRKGAVPILDIETILGRKVKLEPELVFNVLFVCTGNSCRSAMAQGILEQRLRHAGVIVRSAGTETIAGIPPREHSVAAAREYGADISGLRSTPLTASLISEADLILGMSVEHELRILELAPEAASRTFLLAEYAGLTRIRDIPDPIGSSLEVYREVAKLINQCLDRVVRDIEARRLG